MKKFAIASIFALLMSASASAFSLGDIPQSLADALGDWNATNTGLTVFPILSIPLGGEYEAMATAYTAVARDSSYFDANPAASSRLATTELALLHNNIIADANLEGITYTIRYGDLGLGFGGKFLHVPFTEYNLYGAQENSVRYTETVAGINASYNFLNSFNFHGISAGANVKVAYRNIPTVIAPGQSAFGVMADLGVLTRFNLLKFYPSRTKNFSVGVTAKNLGPAPLGEPLPSSLNAGIAFAPLRPLTLSADVNMPFVMFSDAPAEPLGFATGMSVAVTDFFAAQTGFQLKGGNPRFAMGGSLTWKDIRFQMNYTLDMTTQTSSVDRFSVQAAFNFGDRGRADVQRQVEEYYLDALVAYANGDIESTVALCNQALELDPTFQPAADTKTKAQRMLTLQHQMEAIRLGTAGDSSSPAANQ